MTSTTTDAKVKLRPLTTGCDWIVTVPGGREIRICRRDNERDPFHVSENGWSGRGWQSLEQAVRDAAKVAKIDLPALPISPEDLRAMAVKAESDPREATKIFRTLLKARTGRDWSATIGRGTAWSWTKISAPKARMVDYSMSIEDTLLLSAALGTLRRGDLVSHQGESIRPCSGVRGSYVFRLAGYAVPADWRIAEPGWD